MRVSKKPEERRSEILDAAAGLFVSKGYVQTTVNDILNAVGIAKGTFYYHFQSKEEVMDAIVTRFIDAGVANARAVASAAGIDAREKLFRIVGSVSPAVDMDGKEEMIEQMHSAENAEMHQKSLVETILKLTPVITEIVEQGIAEGSFNTPYPREVVEFVLTSSQFLLDAGIFDWSAQEIGRKAKVFAWIMETLLGTEKGTFDYIAERYIRTAEKHGPDKEKAGGSKTL